MWQIKKFKTRELMDSWVEKNEGKVQWREVYINQSARSVFKYAVDIPGAFAPNALNISLVTIAAYTGSAAVGLIFNILGNALF